MQELTIDGMRGVYTRPDGDPAGRGLPGVVVLHEAYGLNADIRGIAARFASAGYAALAPDLYSPGVRPLCIARTVLDVFRHDGQDTVPRVQAARRALGDRPGVDPDRVGVIGFCMGGGLAVLAAARGDFGAASVNYGEVPERTAELEGICPVVGSFGADDGRLRDMPGRLRSALDELDVPHDVEVYEGAGHSFMNRSSPGPVQRFTSVGYRPEQAEDAWRRILAFFGAHLDGPDPAGAGPDGG